MPFDCGCPCRTACLMCKVPSSTELFETVDEKCTWGPLSVISMSWVWPSWYDGYHQLLQFRIAILALVFSLAYVLLCQSISIPFLDNFVCTWNTSVRLSSFPRLPLMCRLLKVCPPNACTYPVCRQHWLYISGLVYKSIRWNLFRCWLERLVVNSLQGLKICLHVICSSVCVAMEFFQVQTQRAFLSLFVHRFSQFQSEHGLSRLQVVHSAYKCYAKACLRGIA